MLYDCWRRIVSRRPDETAILDVPAGRCLSFAQLARAVEEGSTASEPFAFPQGVTSDFVLSVLRAWRAGQVVCPLEIGQAPPEIPGGLRARREWQFRQGAGSRCGANNHRALPVT